MEETWVSIMSLSSKKGTSRFMFYLFQTTMLHRTLPETCLWLLCINTAVMGSHGGLGVCDKNVDGLLLATSVTSL